MVGESTKRKSRKKGGAKRPPPGPPPLSPDEKQLLRAFVRFGLGDGHLTPWEEKFLSDRHLELYGQIVWLTDKQQASLQQIKDKLNYDRQHIPLSPIDPDGVEENDDPDVWPVVTAIADPFEDDEPPDWAAP
jgi:hypothetical protein